MNEQENGVVWKQSVVCTVHRSQNLKKNPSSTEITEGWDQRDVLVWALTQREAPIWRDHLCEIFVILKPSLEEIPEAPWAALLKCCAALRARKGFPCAALIFAAGSAHSSLCTQQQRRRALIQWGIITPMLKGLGGDTSGNNAQLNVVQTFRRGETAAERWGRAALYCS